MQPDVLPTSAVATTIAEEPVAPTVRHRYNEAELVGHFRVWYRFMFEHEANWIYVRGFRTYLRDASAIATESRDVYARFLSVIFATSPVDVALINGSFSR